MYFSGLRRAIQDVEEKKFYDVSLLFLESEGYKELSVIDGTGDGGRDVICSRTDLRIQLSVRKDWENKINDEADVTRAASKRHLIYVTNRPIRDTDLNAFKKNNYRQKGEVELTVIDLNRISTALSSPGVMKAAYERLGYLVQGKIAATSKEIALSNLLLFSNEAKDLRQDVIESNIRAHLLKNPDITIAQLVSSISSGMPGVDIEHDIRSATSRLASRGDILTGASRLHLSEPTRKSMEAAEEDYLQSISHDIDQIKDKYSLSTDESPRVS